MYDVPPTLFTTAEARATGLSSKEMLGRVRRGGWIALRRGVFVDAATWRVATPAAQYALRVSAALRAVRGDSVASHISAVRLHGLELLTPPADEAVVLTRDASGIRGTRRRPDLLVHLAGLPAAHRAVPHGVPATSPARTALDLARVLPPRDAVVLLDSTLRRTPTRRWELDAILRDCENWPGIGRAARAVAFADPKAESVLESLARVVFAEQRLPVPQTQVCIGDPATGFDRVDFLWSAWRTVGEADGLTKYTDPHALRAEKLREERLRELGFEVVRFTWSQGLQRAGAHGRARASRLRARSRVGGLTLPSTRFAAPKSSFHREAGRKGRSPDASVGAC